MTSVKSVHKHNKLKLAGRWLINIAFIVLVFWLGLAVGSGRLVLGREAIFHKPVSNDLPAQLNFSSVQQVYNTLRTSYDGQLTSDQLLDGVKSGLAQATGDPFTEYLNAKDAKDFNDLISGSFTGIGAELAKDDSKNIIIMSVLPGTPAERAGLHAKDAIALINDKSAFDITVDSAKNQIRGPKGSQVKLKIVRDGKQLDFEITRDTITIPSVSSKILDGNIGYLQITQFAPDTTAAAQKAADQFKRAGVKGVVLDLRGDGGGYVDAAVSVSSLWVPSGKTVLTERRGGEVVQTDSSEGTDTLTGIPTVVLIDGSSASASEITAAALHDNKLATLMGQTSFGKGSMQEVDNLSDGAELKVTIAHWYTPNGINVNKKGIKPDKVIDRTDDDIKAGKDPQLEAATTSLNK